MCLLQVWLTGQHVFPAGAAVDPGGGTLAALLLALLQGVDSLPLLLPSGGKPRPPPHPSPQSHVTFSLSCNDCVCAASMASRCCAAPGSASAGQRGVDLLAGPGPPQVGGAAAGLPGRQFNVNTQTLHYPQPLRTPDSSPMLSQCRE